MADYTPEQIKDITEREQKGLDLLKELQLSPAAQINKLNLGNDTFVDKVTPYLADTKYTPQPSPVKAEDVAEKGDEKVL